MFHELHAAMNCYTLNEVLVPREEVDSSHFYDYDYGYIVFHGEIL